MLFRSPSTLSRYPFAELGSTLLCRPLLTIVMAHVEREYVGEKGVSNGGQFGEKCICSGKGNSVSEKVRMSI